MPGGLTNIRMFVAAYEEGTFTAAAVRENATQPGVSQHVGLLEHTLGVQLFIRTKSGVVPTPAGRDFYHRCVALIRQHNEAMESTRAYSDGLAGEITVGLIPTLAQAAVAPALSRFIRAHPNVRVLVVEGYSAVLTDRLLAGDIDVATVPAFPGRLGLQAKSFAIVPEVLVGALNPTIPHGAPVSLRDLQPVKLVVPSSRNTRRQTIETYCASNGIYIDRSIELDSVSGSIDFVANSDWRAILPLPAVINKIEEQRISVNRLASAKLDLELVMVWSAQRELPPPAVVFQDMLAETLEELISSWTAQNYIDS